MPSLPSCPGVYSFLGEKKEILYVGKAKDLRKRISSYTRFNQLTPRIQKLVSIAIKLEFQKLDGEFEALLIEAELIRIHQPLYNVLLKDDKSRIYLHITNETFPRVLKVRKTDIDRRKLKGTLLGPYQSSYKLNEVLKITRRIFPWCNLKKDQKLINKIVNLSDQFIGQKEQLRPCFYRHLKLCPGACTGEITTKDYQEQINNIVLFLKGKKKAVLKSIKVQMQEASQKQEYEKAALFKQQIEYITEVTQPEYRLKPNLILPSMIKSKSNEGLLNLKKILLTHLSLPRTYQLKRIEGYDVSNIQGKNAAVSQVVFIDGIPSKKDYRLFNIKTLDTPNDYKMLQIAITRRQNHPEWGKPNLLVIDGGRGQVRSVLKIWNWKTPVIGLVKDPDRIVIPILEKKEKKKNKNNKREIVPPSPLHNIKVSYVFVKLPENHPTLHLLQQIRDESHRFAKKQHTRLATRQLLPT